MYLDRNVFPTIIIPLGQIFITTAATTIFFQTIRDKINPSSSRLSISFRSNVFPHNGARSIMRAAWKIVFRVWNWNRRHFVRGKLEQNGRGLEIYCFEFLVSQGRVDKIGRDVQISFTCQWIITYEYLLRPP